MSMVERIFLLDASSKNGELYISGINDIHCKVERCIGYWNTTYCIVFDEEKFNSLLCGFQGGTVSVEKICNLSCNNKNLFHAMLTDEPLNIVGSLVQLYLVSNVQSLVKFLKANAHHRQVFNYSRFFDKPANIIAMQYSMKVKKHIFKFHTLINNICYFRGQELIKIDETDEFPFKQLPLVTLDLEVVALRDETFPLGIKKDEKITHVTVIINHQNKELIYTIVVQGIDRLKPYYRKNKILQTVESEKELIVKLIADIASHKFLKMFGLSRNTAFLLTGYNIDNFDLSYLYTRSVLLGLYDIANMISIQHGISPLAFSFDLWHAEARIFAGIQNCSLKKVSQMFLNETKLELNVTAIRKLYNNQHENLDLTKNNGKCYYLKNGSISNVPTAEYFLDYNIVDCLLVKKLYEKQAVLDLLHRMCVFCNLPYYQAISCGNSKRLENLMFLFALNQMTWIMELPVYYLPNPKTDSIFHLLQKIDRDAMNLHKVTEICSTNILIFEDREDELYSINSIKGFAGGANDAVRSITRNVFGLDAESFYPSIIKEYNLDLNNVLIVDRINIPPKLQQIFCQNHYVFAYSNQGTSVIDTPDWVWPQLHDMTNYNGLVLIILKTQSMLKNLVQQLLDDRSKCKELLKIQFDPTVKAKELAYKTMSCCVFGVLGYKEFVYERIFVAAAITFLARSILRLCVQKLKPKDVSIVYVDTDGIMCSSPHMNTQEEVNALSIEISKELGFKCIRFKPENMYKLANILSCKKYITLDTELVCKGFEKNAIAPIKKLFRDWFSFYFELLLKKPYQKYNVKINTFELLIAIFTYMGNLKFNIREWALQKTVQEHTSSQELTDFYKRLLLNGTSVGDRISLLALLDQSGNEIFKLVDWYNNEEINYKYFLRNYIQYLLSFSSTDSIKVTNKMIDHAFNKYQSGSQLDFKQVQLDINEL